MEISSCRNRLQAELGDYCPNDGIGRRAWLRTKCPLDVGVRIPLRAPFEQRQAEKPIAQGKGKWRLRYSVAAP